MAEIIGFVVLVVSIVAVAMLKACHDEIRKNEDRIEDLTRQIRRLQASSGRGVEDAPSQPLEGVPEKVISTSAVMQELRQEISVPPQVDVPARPAPKEVPGVSARTNSRGSARGSEARRYPRWRRGLKPRNHQPKPLFDGLDRDRWATLEVKLGKQWMTWVGAIVLFLSVGFFVKYAFEHKWLGEAARVILGGIAGMSVLAAGERFVRRKMRALGQGLVGAGLAILYVSLFAAYGLYGLLPQTVTFVLMVIVTAGGMALAVIHDAVAVSFLAVLGGLLTPVLLRTGRDPRDALFAYVLLLDLGVLGVALFKRWRMLDVLAFIGTWALFTGWYFTFRHVPTYSTNAHRLVARHLLCGVPHPAFRLPPAVGDADCGRTFLPGGVQRRGNVRADLHDPSRRAQARPRPHNAGHECVIPRLGLTHQETPARRRACGLRIHRFVGAVSDHSDTDPSGL